MWLLKLNSLRWMSLRRLWHPASGRRGVLSILAGTASGQIVALLAAPVLSRLFDPSAFGVFAVVTAIVSVLGGVAALRFELAIPIPSQDRDAYSIVALGMISCAGMFVVGSICVGVGGSAAVAAFGVPALLPWLWFAPAIAAVMGMSAVLNQLAIRHRRYGAIARRTLAQATATVGSQIGTGIAGIHPGGLVIGLGVGQLTSAAALFGGAGLRSPAAKEGRSFRRMKSACRRYARFPLLLAPSGLLNIVGQQLPLVLIALWYGTEVAGWLGMAQRVLALPVMLVGISVAQVYLGRVSEAARENADEVRRLFNLTSWRLAVVAICVALGVTLLSPWLFSTLLGARWANSGMFAQAMAISLAAQLVAVPVSQTLIILERQFLQLAWDVGRLVLVTGGVAVCWALGGSATAAVWTSSGALATSYAVSWTLSKFVVNTRFDKEHGQMWRT